MSVFYFHRFDNPASVSDTPSRQLTYNYLVALNIWLLVFPASLCCDWTMGSLLPVQTIFDRRNLATIAMYATIVKLIRQLYRRYVTAHTLKPNRQDIVLMVS